VQHEPRHTDMRSGTLAFRNLSRGVKMVHGRRLATTPALEIRLSLGVSKPE
jgi:hypothetical protein